MVFCSVEFLDWVTVLFELVLCRYTGVFVFVVLMTGEKAVVLVSIFCTVVLMVVSIVAVFVPMSS